MRKDGYGSFFPVGLGAGSGPWERAPEDVVTPSAGYLIVRHRGTVVVVAQEKTKIWESGGNFGENSRI